MTRRGIGLAMLFLTTAFLAADDAGGAAPPPRERIPIHAWMGPPAEETTVERYRELADCGFTQNFSHFPNIESTVRELDVAREAGIQQIVSTPELESDPEGTSRRLKDHPALAGYHLRDEPSAADFPALAKWVKRIQSVDPEHGCYINLFPNYAGPSQLGTATYQEHVDRFLAEVPVPYLSFDHYPVTTGGLRPEFYENLEIISKAARNARKPFWAFVLAVAHDPYPIARLEHMRLQAFSNLAYGAECIQYFTYWTPVSTVWNFHQAPIEGGQRTRVYNRVKQMNREIQALAPVFVGARVARIGHTGTLPRGTTPYQPEAPVTGLRTNGEGAVVSLLEEGRSRHLVIVNRDYRQPLSLAVSFDGSVRVQRLKKDGTAAKAGRQYSGEVAPGDIAAFRWTQR
ncbi:MAG TPA: beta-galactosidase [Armatimonadota bacterium]|nr:beta-galactosidase [Armatimonadota bacterium]